MSKGGSRKRLRKRVLQALTLRFGPALAALYIRLVGATARVMIIEPQRYREMWPRGPFILAFWHGRMLGLPPMLPPGEKISVLISQHRDGELITRTIERFGIGAVRGSSTRGARDAVQEMLRLLEAGESVAITPDGPRGPAEVSASGAVRVASLAGAPIIAVSWAARPGKHLRSWDRFLLPAPWCRVVYAVEPDIRVAPDVRDEEVVKLTEELTFRLKRAGDRALAAVSAGEDPFLDPRPAPSGRWVYRAYDALLLVGLALLTPMWIYRWITSSAVRGRLGERWAHYGQEMRSRLRRGSRPVWVHAVSVGELNAILPLVRALSAPGPNGEPGSRIVLSTVTVTGNATARSKAPPGTEVLYLPVDLSWVVRRAIATIRPRLFVSTESEIWPGLLRELERAKVPAAMANGRVSERTASRYRWAGGFGKDVLARIRLFAMQNDTFRDRIVAMGAPAERARVLGNLKFDLEVEPVDAEDRARRLAALGLAGRVPVLVGGSTHDGEEDALLDALDVLTRAGHEAALVLAPRHPERFDVVARSLAQRGIRFHRSSATGAAGEGPVTVHLLDSIGQLAQVYGVGDVAFVGGTLPPIGGHNLLEPAVHGIPLLFGPHTESCEDIAQALLAANAAIRIRDRVELAAALSNLVADPTRAREMGARGRELVRSHRGATQRTAAVLRALLDEPEAAEAPEARFAVA